MPGARDHAIVLALLAALTLPFSGKAFHIDDAFFIAVAENIRRDPWRPFAGAVALDDTDHRVFLARGGAPNTFETLSHPPLVPYVIAAVAAARGRITERSQHAAFFVLAAVAALAQYRLARRFTAAPLFATLLLVSSPIFVLGAQSLMTDMPALALSLAALALFVDGVDTGSARRLLWSGLFAGLAIVTRYTALGLIPLGLGYVLLNPSRSRRHALLALLPLSAVVGAWCLQNGIAHGAVHLASSARHYVSYYEGRYFAADALARRALNDLSTFGGTAIPAAVVVALGTRRRRPWSSLAWAASAAVLVAVFGPLLIAELRDYSAAARLALAACLATGLFLVVEAARRGLAGTREARFLLFWMVAGLLGTVIALPFGAARYMLTVLPPLCLLLCPSTGEAEAETAVRRPSAGLLAVASGALAFVLSVADSDHAEAYRRVAQAGPGFAGAGRVFFLGDWGFRYYMERAGHRYLLSTDGSPGEGDLIVKPRVAANHDLAPALAARSTLAHTVEVGGRLPVRLLDRESHAGFHSHGWGYLPFAFSTAPLETFDVYRVGPSS